jgi:hypothetical protein
MQSHSPAFASIDAIPAIPLYHRIRLKIAELKLSLFLFRFLFMPAARVGPDGIITSTHHLRLFAPVLPAALIGLYGPLKAFRADLDGRSSDHKHADKHGDANHQPDSQHDHHLHDKDMSALEKL